MVLAQQLLCNEDLLGHIIVFWFARRRNVSTALGNIKILPIDHRESIFHSQPYPGIEPGTTGPLRRRFYTNQKSLISENLCYFSIIFCFYNISFCTLKEVCSDSKLPSPCWKELARGYERCNFIYKSSESVLLFNWYRNMGVLFYALGWYVYWPKSHFRYKLSWSSRCSITHFCPGSTIPDMRTPPLHETNACSLVHAPLCTLGMDTTHSKATQHARTTRRSLSLCLCCAAWRRACKPSCCAWYAHH